MEKAAILIVDDTETERFFLEFHVKEWGFTPLVSESGTEALKLLKANHIDLILSDMIMPKMDGLQFLNEVKKRYNDIPFIMLTAYGSIDNAVASIKQGADDYIIKPINPAELHAVIKKSLSYLVIREENKRLKDHLASLYSFQSIVTKSPVMMNALKMAERVAKTPNTTVAIYGESGTGKEVLARAIHFAGERMGNRFVTINCAAIPSSLLESELFGHVKGAFTGADKEREGKFEFAQNGTILLDEIGDMNIELQAKLLRVLEERTFEKLGSNRTIKADFRVIVATHRNLEEMVREGKFREDLYHRINTFPITLPPLRERKEDIPLLSNFFLDQLRKELGKPLPGISEKAMDMLLSYSWHGNIRELKNCLERAAIIVGDELIRPEHLNIKESSRHNKKTSADNSGKVQLHIDLPPEEMSLDNIIKQVMQITLEQCDNNKSRAAELLKVSRQAFYRHK
jgi:DNA-binding NtrC family response regulator